MLDICHAMKDAVECSMGCDIRYGDNFDLIDELLDGMVVLECLALLRAADGGADSIACSKSSDEDGKTYMARGTSDLSICYLDGFIWKRTVENIKGTCKN